MQCLQEMATEQGKLIKDNSNWTLLNHIIWLIKRSTNFFVVYFTQTGIKYVDMVNLSTTTKIESYPLTVKDRPTIKYIRIRSHFQVGMGILLDLPLDRWCSQLTCWHVKHHEKSLQYPSSYHTPIVLSQVIIYLCLAQILPPIHKSPLKSKDNFLGFLSIQLFSP